MELPLKKLIQSNLSDLTVHDVYVLEFVHKNMVMPFAIKQMATGLEYVQIDAWRFTSMFPEGESSKALLNKSLSRLVQKSVLTRLDNSGNFYAYTHMFYDLYDILETDPGGNVIESKKPKISREDLYKQKCQVLAESIRAFRAENPGRYSKEIYTAFYEHWSQPTLAPKPLKLGYELQPTWKLSSRLYTFAENQKRWSAPKNNQPQPVQGVAPKKMED